MSGPAASSLQPGYIIRGTILSVNSRTYRAEVALDVANGAIPDVQVAALYCHPFGGEGIYFLPEPDATCYVFLPSEPNGRPFILGYVMPPTGDAGDSGGREAINPGDYILKGRDDNFIALRRGGIVEIGATRLAQRLYVPVGNLIRDFFEGYEALSLLGKMQWTHSDPGIEGSKVTYHFECKESVESPLPKVIFEVSSDTVDLMPDRYLNTQAESIPEFSELLQSYLRLRVVDSTGVQQEFVFQLSKEGDLYLHAAGYVLLTADGPVRIESQDGRIEFIGPTHSDKTSAIGERSLQMVAWDLQAESRIIEKAPLIVLEGKRLMLGAQSAFHRVGYGDVIESWANTVLIPALAASSATIAVPPLTGASSLKVRVS